MGQVKFISEVKTVYMLYHLDIVLVSPSFLDNYDHIVPDGSSFVLVEHLDQL